MASIQKSVGLKCKNDKWDVLVVQMLLNKFIMPGCLPPLAPLMLDGQCGNKTVTAIYAFQNGIMGQKKPPMSISPDGLTIERLNGPLKWCNRPAGDGGVINLPTPEDKDITFGDPVMISALCAKSHADWGHTYGTKVYAIDAWTLALNVQKAAGDAPIGRLHVFTHGYYDGPEPNTDGIFLPNLEIRADNVNEWGGPLGRLKPHFDYYGDAVFYGCWAGSNMPLMRALARTLGVPVYGGTRETSMNTGRNYGFWRGADPTGLTLGRPPYKDGSDNFVLIRE
jgi:hypothetical protein